MSGYSFFETEALPVSLRVALARSAASASLVEKVEAAIKDHGAQDLNSALIEVIRSLPSSIVETSDEYPPPAPRAVGLRLQLRRSHGPDGRPNKMLFIRFKDAAPVVGISLVALAIAVAMLSPAAIAPALTTVKGVYDNVVLLKSPADDDAMQAYEVLLRDAAEHVVDHTTTAYTGITIAQVLEFGGPSPERVRTALKRLKEVGLAEVAAWGDAAGDLGHDGNRWRHRV
jgi:hypothetical protein